MFSSFFKKKRSQVEIDKEFLLRLTSVKFNQEELEKLIKEGAKINIEGSFNPLQYLICRLCTDVMITEEENGDNTLKNVKLTE